MEKFKLTKGGNRFVLEIHSIYPERSKIKVYGYKTSDFNEPYYKFEKEYKAFSNDTHLEYIVFKDMILKEGKKDET